MPYCNIKTTVKGEKDKEMELSHALAKVIGMIPGKTEDWVMTSIDDEAAMTCPVNEWSANSPFNARGGYTNMFWHMTYRYLNDFTENCIVLLLD